MIKYIDLQSFDEYGQHIVPIDNLTGMTKVASGSYSPEIMSVILSLVRKPQLYYVVINALGSHEVWGPNGNADAFPEIGLAHKSLRTDMGTKNDYGYKTFEYYAHFFKHHVNKPDSPRYGEVVFSHWNPILHRVELVVGIDREKAKEVVTALENNEPVAVSMGTKVPYDRCSICDNKARKKEEYCKHARDFLGAIVGAETAKIWSRELGKVILPGAKVFVYNDFPRFFDISRVWIGADRTSFILKAASQIKVAHSVNIGEAYGITDEMVDKFSNLNKSGEITKIIGAMGPNTIDGSVSKSKESVIVRKALAEKINKAIQSEPEIDVDMMARAIPLNTILSTMVGMGIHPKPREFQRIVLIRSGKIDLANKLDANNEVFDYTDDSNQVDINISDDNFSDTLGRVLAQYAPSRSCYAKFLEPRLVCSQCGGTTEVSKIASGMSDIAALYAGLKLKASGQTISQIKNTLSRPWMSNLIGGGVLLSILGSIRESESPLIDIPASQYEGMLDNYDFSGHKKVASQNAIISELSIPAMYIKLSYNQVASKRVVSTPFGTITKNK